MMPHTLTFSHSAVMSVTSCLRSPAAMPDLVSSIAELISIRTSIFSPAAAARLSISRASLRESTEWIITTLSITCLTLLV